MGMSASELRIRLDDNLINGDFARITDLLDEYLVVLRPGEPSADRVVRARRLAYIGHRVVELDAEDFGSAADCPDLPEVTRAVLRQAAAPRSPGEPLGQLSSLRTIMQVQLELLQLHYASDRFGRVLEVLHLIGEYLPILAWEPVLGNAGNPHTIARRLDAVDAVWVRRPQPCPRAAKPFYASRDARNAVKKGPASRRDPDAAWLTYVKEQRGGLADLLQACGLCGDDTLAGTKAVAGAPCGIEPTSEERGTLPERLTSISDFKKSLPIKQRNTAPIGHGYSVPDRAALDDAWQRSRQSITDRDYCPLDLSDLDERAPFPGLATLIRYWGDLDEVPEPTELVPQIGDAINRLLFAPDAVSGEAEAR